MMSLLTNWSQYKFSSTKARDFEIFTAMKTHIVVFWLCHRIMW